MDIDPSRGFIIEPNDPRAILVPFLHHDYVPFDEADHLLEIVASRMKHLDAGEYDLNAWDELSRLKVIQEQIETVTTPEQ